MISHDRRLLDCHLDLQKVSRAHPQTLYYLYCTLQLLEIEKKLQEEIEEAKTEFVDLHLEEGNAGKSFTQPPGNWPPTPQQPSGVSVTYCLVWTPATPRRGPFYVGLFIRDCEVPLKFSEFNLVCVFCKEVGAKFFDDLWLLILFFGCCRGWCVLFKFGELGEDASYVR